MRAVFSRKASRHLPRMQLSFFVYDCMKQPVHLGFRVWLSQAVHEPVYVEAFFKLAFVGTHPFSQSYPAQSCPAFAVVYTGTILCIFLLAMAVMRWAQSKFLQSFAYRELVCMYNQTLCSLLRNPVCMRKKQQVCASSCETHYSHTLRSAAF